MDPQPARNLVKPKPRPRPRARQGKPPTVHEGVENPTNLPMLRTSERKDFKRCPQRWHWGWREGLKPNGPPNDKLWFGTGWHLVMAHIYGKPGTARGKQPLKTWRDWVGEEMPKIRVNLSGNDSYKEEVYVDAAALGEEMIGNYLDKWGADPTWHVVQVEKPFEVIVTDRTGEPRVIFCGTYDGVYIDLRDDGLWLMEHKTAKAISTSHLELDDQAGGYFAIAARELAHAGLIPKGKQLRGIMYNFARKAPKPDDSRLDSDGIAHNNPTKAHYLDQLGEVVTAKMSLATMEEIATSLGTRVWGDVSKNQPTPLFARHPVRREPQERNTILLGMQAEVEHMEAMRTGALPLYKTPTMNCAWDCNFYQMCILHNAGDQSGWEEYKRSVYHKENPYADHIKTSAGEEMH